jgi:hypothetical protein
MMEVAVAAMAVEAVVGVLAVIKRTIHTILST